MSQLPERYQAAIAPLIDQAREFLEKGAELAAMAFVGTFTTGAVVPPPLFGRGPADKDVAARSVKMLAEQLAADFVFVLMEAYSLRADKVARYEEILEEYGSLATLDGDAAMLYGVSYGAVDLGKGAVAGGGGPGADRMVGGNGPDRYCVDNPGDQHIEHAGAPGPDTVISSLASRLNTIADI